MKSARVRIGIQFAFLLLMVSPVFASEAGASGHHIPAVVFYQALNLGLLLVLLHFWQRKALVGYFSHRQKSYLEARSRAVLQRQEAEQRHAEITDRLNNLTNSASQAVDEARREAEQLRKELVLEAQKLAEKLKTEAERTAQFELSKAINQLRETMIDEAIAATRSQLANLGDVDRQALHQEFVEKIQVVPS